MKTIGIIGGMSWESSLEYYRIINQKVKENLGGLHSAKLILNSLDFAEVEKLQHNDDWDLLTEMMIAAARSLEKAGADLIMIGTNTMHKMADEVLNSISIPFLHIADAAGEAIKSKGLKKVALLGTKFTMEQHFYKNRLSQNYGIEVLIPSSKDRDFIHKVIYEELCNGNIRQESRQEFIRIINTLQKQGAEGAVLGCTEIPLLITQKDSAIPVFDTMTIHAEYAVKEACK